MVAAVSDAVNKISAINFTWWVFQGLECGAVKLFVIVLAALIQVLIGEVV